MCASVCPSEALWFGTLDEFDDTRSGTLVNDWWFGRQYVRTKVYTVVATSPAARSTCSPPTHRAWQDDPFGLDEPAAT